MSNPWFETVAEAQRRAKRRLPTSVYRALVAGSEKGLTADDNVAAFGELGLAPHVAGLFDERDLATTVMGQPISMPVIISPTGVQAVHPDGEVAVARAAAARGTVMGLSCFASKPIEEVVEANPQTFFQTYWVGDKDEMSERLERVRAAGAVGLIATFDWSFAVGRDWGSPVIPEQIDLRTALRFAPEVLASPPLAAGLRQDQGHPRSHRPQPGPAGPGRPHLLRGLREVDADTQPRLGRRGLAARPVGRPVHAEGRGPGGRCQAGRGCRGHGHLGVQPRRQQPRRHPGHDPDAARHRRGRGRPGRGAARRGHPAGQRRGQGPGPRGSGRHDRTGLPLGSGRQRPDRRGERPRPPPRGYRLGLLGLGRASVHDLSPDDVVVPPGFTRRLGAPAGD